jgi:rhodanese-related sulfurtransferase
MAGDGEVLRSPPMDDIPELTIAEVVARLGQPGFHVIDNNSPARWKRSHVPGAINLNPHDFTADALPADRAATLVFYCSGPG